MFGDATLKHGTITQKAGYADNDDQTRCSRKKNATGGLKGFGHAACPTDEGPRDECDDSTSCLVHIAVQTRSPGLHVPHYRWLANHSSDVYRNEGGWILSPCVWSQHDNGQSLHVSSTPCTFQWLLDLPRWWAHYSCSCNRFLSMRVMWEHGHQSLRLSRVLTREWEHSQQVCRSWGLVTLPVKQHRAAART